MDWFMIYCGGYHWLCSHENDSRSERRSGSRSKTWLGSWFELRTFTCIAKAFPITIRICALRGNILFLLRSPRWLTHAWLQHGFSAHFQNTHSRITFGKSFAFTCPRIRLSTRITIQNAPFRVSKRVSKAWFETALRSQGLKSGFHITGNLGDTLLLASREYRRVHWVYGNEILGELNIMGSFDAAQYVG